MRSTGNQPENLHRADSNRHPLSEGALGLDTINMALYLGGYNSEGRCVTLEPLGPGADPYPAMNEKPHQQLEDLAQQTTTYFRERKEELRI